MKTNLTETCFEALFMLSQFFDHQLFECQRDVAVTVQLLGVQELQNGQVITDEASSCQLGSRREELNEVSEPGVFIGEPAASHSNMS